jgi:hypothetical protein
MRTFKIGDIVCHIAGKTKMAVAAIKMPDGDLVCEWQDDHGEPHRETYPAACLELWSDREARNAEHRAAMMRKIEDERQRGGSWARSRRGRG